MTPWSPGVEKRGRVLVTDGEQRSALAVVRSLGRAEHEVIVGATARRSLAGASRFAHSEILLPDPLSRPEPFAERLAEVVHRMGVDVLLPITDASILAVLESDELFSRVNIPFPPLDTQRAVSDKARLVRAGRRAGIATPASAEVTSAVEMEGIDLGQIGPPYVLKPARSVAGGPRDRIKTRVAFAKDRPELERLVESMPLQAFPLLVQEFVPGTGQGIFLLRWGEETLAFFAHRRIREKPPSGGVSVYRESVPADPELVAASERLLEAFDWRGVAMVEYRRSDADGIPYLMEVNGRFWGSLQLAIDSGVDFPRLLVAAALGQAPDPVEGYQSGVRCRWWWGDVDHLMARMRGVGPRPGEEDQSRLRTLAEVLIPWRPGDRSEVFRWRDPYPFLRESRQWLTQMIGSADG